VAFELRSEGLGALPLINHFLARVKLAPLLEAYLGDDDARVLVAPGDVLGVVVRNLMVSHRPLYALSEWAEPFAPAALGLSSAALNDDRVARACRTAF
jgi:hypothetical protein